MRMLQKKGVRWNVSSGSGLAFASSIRYFIAQGDSCTKCKGVMPYTKQKENDCKVFTTYRLTVCLMIRNNASHEKEFKKINK